MNIILIMRMKIKIFFNFLLICVATNLLAATPAETLYSNVEQHLHSLKTLEIRYEAVGAALPNGSLEGRMIWSKPNLFYHETPEWTLCETGDSEWRYLKTQNTLIWEDSKDQSTFMPENLLFVLSKDVQAESLEEKENGLRLLTIKTSSSDNAGKMTMELPAGSLKPERISFIQADGSKIQYRIRQWNESIKIDSALLIPPEVPSENRIDFRRAGKDK
jgi:outer membrane lipoprotein-sorting protein